MKLDLGQTAERLGITKERVIALEHEGRLTNLRPPVPGAKKCFRQFDQKEVNALKTAGDYPSKRSGGYKKANGHAEPPVQMTATLPPPAPVPPPITGLLTRLTQIEQKLDQLLALWK